MLRCLLYSEFHTLKGPTVVSQSPQQYITEEVFDCISDFIITDSKLAGRLITFSAFGSKFVSQPMCIDNPKYHRNQLLFNITFVFDKNVETVSFEPVARKLGAALRTLEVETELLSNLSERHKIQGILDRLLSDLNELGQSVLNVDEVHAINLVVARKSDFKVRVIMDHEVPVVVKRIKPEEIQDLCVRRIFQNIDGVKFVRRISIEAEVNIEMAKECLQQLLFFGIIRLIDLFQYRNEYLLTSKIHSLLHDSKLLEQCMQYVSVNPLRQPHPIVVFRLLCSMRPGRPLSQLCKMQFDFSADEKLLRPDDYGIDERRLVTFARINGMIRRLHRYPVDPANQLWSFSDDLSTKKSGFFSKNADGKNCIDNIACLHCEPVGTVESVLRSSTVFIDKVQSEDQ